MVIKKHNRDNHHKKVKLTKCRLNKNLNRRTCKLNIQSGGGDSIYYIKKGFSTPSNIES